MKTRSIFWLLAALAVLRPATAQQVDDLGDVYVSMKALVVWGPTNGALASAYATMTCYGLTTTQTTVTRGSSLPPSSDTNRLGARMVPGVEYTVQIGVDNGAGWNASGGTPVGALGCTLSVVAPPGYSVEIDGAPCLVRWGSFDETIKTSNIYMKVRLVAPDRDAGLPAGAATSLRPVWTPWKLSLGRTANGLPAGTLFFNFSTATTSFANTFTRFNLKCDAASSDVLQLGEASNINVIKQVIAPQVCIDIYNPTFTGGVIELKCYHPAQRSAGVDASGYYTFTGAPYAWYFVRPGTDDAAGVAIEGDIRETTTAGVSSTVAQVLTTKLTRTGTSPSFTWTAEDWHTGSVALTKTVRARSGTSETIDRRDNNNVVALKSTRTYASMLLGEEIVQEVSGTNDPITTSYDFYKTDSSVAAYGNIKTLSSSAGGWQGFEYSSQGPIQITHGPWSNSDVGVPSGFPSHNGVKTNTTYSADAFGALTRPALVETTVAGTTVAKSSTTYTDETPFASFSSHPRLTVVRADRTDYASGSVPLLTTTKFFAENVGAYVPNSTIAAVTTDDFLRGQIHSIQRSDGSKQSFVYQHGTWNGSTFTVSGTVGLDYASALRVIVISGTATTAGNTLAPSESGYPMEAVYLVAGKSTKEVTIRNAYADVVRTESYAWVNGTWNIVGWVNFTWNYAHQLVGRTAINGVQYSATYSGERKTTETDGSGLTLTYDYDAAERVSKVTRPTTAGSTWDTYTYDAAGHVVKDTHSATGSPDIVSSASYDDAGRLRTETPASIDAAHPITHTYAPASRTHTVTMPDGSTRVETAQADGRLASLTGTAVVPEYYSYSIDTGTNPGFATTKVQSGTSSSPRYRSVTTDWLGRATHAEHPSYNGATYTEDQGYSASTGQLLWSNHTGAVPTRYAYDNLGRCYRVCLDYNNNAALDLASSDRISDSDEYVEQISSAWWATKAVWTYPTAGSATAGPKAYTRRRLTGLPANRLEEVQTTDIDGNTSTRTVDVNRSTATLTITTSATGLANANVETIVDGLSSSVTTPDNLTYRTTYDAFGRPTVKTDARNNTTTIAYVSAKPLVYSVTDGAGNPTYFAYDSSGRRNVTTDALGKKSRIDFNLRGQVLHQWGDTGYPVAYGYDSTYGDRTTLTTYRGGSGWTGTTWSSSTGTGDTTTWVYEAASGLLTAKQDAAGKSVDYTYTAAGQTSTRTWARHLGNNPANARVKSTYAYDWRTGELTGVSYNDGSTPSLGYTYTRLGQLDTVTDATGQRTFAYDAAKPWHLESEDFDMGASQATFYGKRMLNRLYDQDKTASTYGSYTIGKVAGRTVGFDLADPTGTSELRQEFTYSNLGRFVGVSAGINGGTARDFVYQYLTNAPLVSGYTTGSNYTVTYGYETTRALRTSVEGKWSTTSLARFDFKFDALGRRRWSKQSGSAFADYTSGTSYGAIYNYYTYNDRGEVETSAMYRGDNPPDTAPADTDELPGRRFEYRYDNLGNRQTAGETGHAEGGDDVYQTNALNQYTSKENNTVRVLGTAAPGASVALGSPVSLVAKRDRAYAADLLPGNASPNAAAGGSVTVRAALPGTTDLLGSVTHKWAVGPQTATLTYDDDGNLLSDGLWAYAYDAENRLIQMTSVNLGGYLHKVLSFKYDYLNRRVEKTSFDGDANTTVTRRYLYDGWALLAELDTSATPAIQRSYTWGLDLAGSLDATGGVGALLWVTNYGGTTTSYFPAYDGNGNVVALVNSSNGGLGATYEYGPFGEVLRTQGSAVDINPFRFSTKFTDTESGLVYYGARYYSPSLGRFINRDPIAEQGGLNLYGFCGNNGINGVDYFGYSWLSKFLRKITDAINKVVTKFESWLGKRTGSTVHIGGGDGANVSIDTSGDWSFNGNPVGGGSGSSGGGGNTINDGGNGVLVNAPTGTGTTVYGNGSSPGYITATVNFTSSSHLLSRSTYSDARYAALAAEMRDYANFATFISHLVANVFSLGIAGTVEEAKATYHETGSMTTAIGTVNPGYHILQGGNTLFTGVDYGSGGGMNKVGAWGRLGGGVRMAGGIAGAAGIGSAVGATARTIFAADTTIANAVPTRLARVVDARFANSATLAAPGASDVFVTAASDIRGISSSSGLAQRLTLLDNAGQLRTGPFAVIEFDTPASGLASPILRTNPGFIQGGLTGGGAREFVLPNLNLSGLQNVTITPVP